MTKYTNGATSIYMCVHCKKGVKRRSDHDHEYCEYSPTKKHEWKQNGLANDTKWSESFVGKHWKLVLILIAALVIAIKLGLI